MSRATSWPFGCATTCKAVVFAYGSGWQFILTPLLLGTGRLDPILVAAALSRIEPGSTDHSVSPSVTLLTIAAWTVIPLLAGAWRTARRDA